MLVNQLCIRTIFLKQKLIIGAVASSKGQLLAQSSRLTSMKYENYPLIRNQLSPYLQKILRRCLFSTIKTISTNNSLHQRELKQEQQQHKPAQHFSSQSMQPTQMELPSSSLDFLIGLEVDYSPPQRQGLPVRSKPQRRKQKLLKMKQIFESSAYKEARKEKRKQYQKRKLVRQMQAAVGKSIDPTLSVDQQLQLFYVKKGKLANLKRAELWSRLNLHQGLIIAVDNAFEHLMNPKEAKSLANQIQLMTKMFKHMPQAPSLHVITKNEDGPVAEKLTKRKHQFWIMGYHEGDISQVLDEVGRGVWVGQPPRSVEKVVKCSDVLVQKQAELPPPIELPLTNPTVMRKHRSPIYLSPDASESLTQVDPESHIYILGGLVDRSVIKNISVNRAMQLGIPVRSLPIRQYMKNRICLNLDHVANMLWKWVEVKDWGIAFEYAAPKRWKKGAGTEGESGSGSDGSDNSDNSEGLSEEDNQTEKEAAPQQASEEKRVTNHSQ